MKSLRLGGRALLGGVAILAGVLALGLSRPAAAADMIGNCELTGQKGSFPLTPAVAGQLTVEVNLPSPGWWNGDTPDTIKDGYEYCMAANIAYRAGLDKVAGHQCRLGRAGRRPDQGLRPRSLGDLHHRRAQEGGRFLGALFQLRYRHPGEEGDRRSTGRR